MQAGRTTYDILVEKIDSAVNTFIPYKPKKVNPQKPWLTNYVFKELEKKRRLWHKYLNNRTEENYLLYRSQNNKTKTCIVDARKNYEHGLLSGPDKHFYAYISRCLNSKLRNFTLVDGSSNCIIGSEEQIAETFAIQFQSVFDRSIIVPGFAPSLPQNTYSAREITTIRFTPEKVKCALESLKTDSSPGPDGVQAVFLSRCRESLCIPMATAMNDIMNAEYFPESWKEAVVIPIFKKGNKLLAENYRPISLTSTPCKCMEKIVVRELTSFFLENQVIPPEQHGFLPRKSTITNLLTRLHQWTLADDNNEPIDVLYLDFEKAFDKIPIGYLLYKLEHYGVRGKLLYFIRGFLQGRKFRVRVGQELSREHDTYSGVPQGSVLGPLLFIVYLSDLYSELKTSYTSFADDTNIYCNPSKQSHHLQEDLDKIKTWTATWKMPLNDSKCTVLHIGRTNPKNNYILGQTEVVKVQKQKDLGIIITEDLKWEQHISHIIKKLNTLIYMVQVSFRDQSTQMILKLYKSFLRPKIEYGQCIWNPYYIKDIEALERVQRRITKIPLELRTLSYRDRLARLNLTTLRERRLRGDLIETFKITSGRYGCNLDLFHSPQLTTLRGHSKKLAKEKTSKLLRGNFLSNRVIYSWNRLSEDVVNSTNINQFKNRLDLEMRTWNNILIHY